MANIGDKYIIEIREEIGKGLYRLKNSADDLVVIPALTAEGFEKYDPEADYQRGLNDAWEAVKQIIDFSPYELSQRFGRSLNGMFWSDELKYIFSNNTPIETLEKLRTYEAEKKAEEEIKVGDEITVRVHSPERTINVIVYDVLKFGSTMVYDTLSFEEGKCFNISWNLEIKKTGRHFPQVAELIAALGGADDE